MIIQQKMVKEVVFSGLSLSISSSYYHSLMKYTSKSEHPIIAKVQMMAGNSYDTSTTTLPSQQTTEKAHSIYQFNNQLSILFEEGQNLAELSISFYYQKSRISISNTQINLTQKNMNNCLELAIADASSQPIGTIAFRWEIRSKADLPFICLKNITCELKNSINAPQVSRFLDIIVGKRRFRNKCINSPLYWDGPFTFFIEESKAIVWGLVEDQSGQRISIPSENIDSFTLLEGFKRVFIADSMEMPRGCIQFYYQSQGLRSLEEYQRQAELEENNQKQILKLTVKTIKGKFKSPYNNVSVRAFCGINFIKTEQTTGESSELIFTVNRYLYLQTRETRCNFIVYSNEEVLGFGAMQLNIVGFFERKVSIIQPATKKQLGYLMVCVQSEKHLTNSIQLADVNLNLGEQPLDKPSCFLSFAIKGCYTRTELQRIDSRIVSFRRFILMKYTKQEEMEIVLTDGLNQEMLKTVVKIEDLKSCGDPVVCKKVLAVRPEVGCTLELACIYGDLNKINVNQVLAKKVEAVTPQQEKRQEQDSLLDQKRGKYAQVKQYRSNLAQEFRQFQESLANHIKSHRNSEKKQSNINLQKKKMPAKSKSLAHSQNQKTYRIMYTSRPLKESEYLHAHQKSEGKQQTRIELPQLKVKGKFNVSQYPTLVFPKIKDVHLDSYKLQQFTNLPRR